MAYVEATLKRLIEEKLGTQRYGLFFATGEGDFFPNGVEESSGSVVTEDGTHYDYWTGWDDEHQVERFDQWQQIDGCVDAGCWNDDEEYLDARREAGLPPLAPPADAR